MKSKIISISALVLGLALTPALAQTNANPATNAPVGTSPRAMEDPTLVEPFYTDNTMGTLRPVEEIRAAWAAMSAENQQKLRDDCTANPTDNASPRATDLCGTLNGFQ